MKIVRRNKRHEPKKGQKYGDCVVDQDGRNIRQWVVWDDKKSKDVEIFDTLKEAQAKLSELQKKK